MQSIFKYIGITCGNRNYDLVFCRFYKTEYNKSVNCILNGIQFEVYGSQQIKSTDIYPTSKKDGERTCLKDNATDFYYNPYVKFDDKAEDIADAFLEFIASNEKNKVKFFGYLVVFEDYFIHSDIYKEDINEDMMRKNIHIEPISRCDKSTSGCIRVSQENIDWLVENIDVGTTIIM